MVNASTVRYNLNVDLDSLLGELGELVPALLAFDRRFSEVFHARLEGRVLSRPLLADTFEAAYADPLGVAARTRSLELLLQLVRGYDELEPEQRLRVLAFARAQPRLHVHLTDCVSLAARKLEHEADPRWLRAGLVAAVLSDQRPDYRDWLLAVGHLHRVARVTVPGLLADLWSAAVADALSPSTAEALRRWS